MKLFIFLLIAGVALRCRAQAQPVDISGKWLTVGHSDFPPGNVLWLAATGRDRWKAVSYSYWGTDFVVANSVVFDQRTRQFSIDSPQIHYHGQLSPDGTSIAGSWSKSGKPHLLEFRHIMEATRVTGPGLQQSITTLKGESDRKVAQQLYGLRLTDRLNPAARSLCEASLPGPHAKQALVALVDRSMFLDLPAADLPAMEKPDSATQTRILGLTRAYLLRTVHQFPNFIATRTTTAFQRHLYFSAPLGPLGQYKATVVYRDGKEKQRSDSFRALGGLTTQGEFGPILMTVLLDMDQGDVAWSHWEQGATGSQAVFRYAVNAQNSHYAVENSRTGYGGEILVDPSTGAVLRVTLKADLEPANPLLAADILVEYGPVDIGGKVYICPLKGIALSESTDLLELNDVAFGQYHLFGSTIRILPGVHQEH